MSKVHHQNVLPVELRRYVPLRIFYEVGRETKREIQNLSVISLLAFSLKEGKLLLLHRKSIYYNIRIFLSPMASTSAISTVDDYIKERLDGASIDDIEGLVTDPITH